MPIMRVSFIVDGFNLYHSVKSAERQLAPKRLRWLNLHSLCETIVRSSLGPRTSLESVHYFSALATHLESKKPDVVRRHRTFIGALESTGVQVTLAKFKRKEHTNRLSEFRVQLPWMRRWWRLPFDSVRLSYRSHEEKETDVAIACKLLELLCNRGCDAAVLMSGDTDLAAAIRTARLLYPTSSVFMALPYDRHNQELERLATRSFKISPQLYERHQFSDVVVGKKGKVFRKPSNW